ncbi:MAG: hypothetical protein QOJ92_270 [Frankiales bacterium]|nr:hypothetical protein [Frankiales bacterium]
MTAHVLAFVTAVLYVAGGLLLLHTERLPHPPIPALVVNDEFEQVRRTERGGGDVTLDGRGLTLTTAPPKPSSNPKPHELRTANGHTCRWTSGELSGTCGATPVWVCAHGIYSVGTPAPALMAAIPPLLTAHLHDLNRGSGAAL